jgi:hypothetical protein
LEHKKIVARNYHHFWRTPGRDLDLDRPALFVRAEIAKSRKPATQPLPGELWEKLRAEAEGKAPDAALLSVPTYPARMLDVDLKRAGVKKWTVESKLDFHATRTAFITMLLESGADVKTCQTLARHATADLTVNTYGRARHERLSATAEAVGKVVFSRPDYISEPKPKVVGLETTRFNSTKLVEAAGIEPASEDLHPRVPRASPAIGFSRGLPRGRRLPLASPSFVTAPSKARNPPA